MENYNNKRTFLNSIKDALRGIWTCIKAERNMRMHVISAVYVVYVSFFLGLSRAEHAILFLVIGLVLLAEMFNTSIEGICDFTQKNFSNRIKSIKDISAGAVLICAMISICVGISIMFRPSLLEFILYIVRSPIKLLLFLLSLVISMIFIFWGPEKIYNKITGYKEDKK